MEKSDPSKRNNLVRQDDVNSELFSISRHPHDVILMTQDFLKRPDVPKHATVVSRQNTLYKSSTRLVSKGIDALKMIMNKYLSNKKLFSAQTVREKLHFKNVRLPLFLPVRSPFREYFITYSNSSRTRIANVQVAYRACDLVHIFSALCLFFGQSK